MKDLGTLYDYELARPSPKKPSKPQKHYPTIEVDGNAFPYLAKKSIGDECTVTVRICKKGERIERGPEKKKHKIELELRGLDEGGKPSSIAEAASRAKDEY